MECPILFSAPHFLFLSTTAKISWIRIKGTGTTLKSISGYKSPLSGDLVVLSSICTDSFPLGARDLLLAVYSYDLFFESISTLYSPVCPEERRPFTGCFVSISYLEKHNKSVVFLILSLYLNKCRLDMCFIALKRHLKYFLSSVIRFSYQLKATVLFSW